MLTPVPPYANLLARLYQLQGVAVAAYVRHAKRPGVHGAAQAHYAAFAAAYEVRAALAEQNPAFAQTLLPLTGQGDALPNRWPLVPAGVRWAVDETAPGTLTVTVDVAGGASLEVVPPVGAPFLPLATLTPARVTATFPAPADGLYALKIQVGGTTLATVYVPVHRAALRLFREHSRALRFAFRLPKAAQPSPEYTAVLARLVAADAAAATGQVDLYHRLIASALAIPAPRTPTALFPSHPCR